MGPPMAQRDRARRELPLMRCDGLGVSLATLRAPEKRRSARGFGRALSNRTGMAIGTVRTRRWCAQERRQCVSCADRRAGRGSQGKPLRACEVAAPAWVDEDTPNLSHTLSPLTIR